MKLPSTSKKSSVFAKATADKTADKSVSRPHSAFRIPHSQGFTLIELMMVVLVILLLSGLLFRLSAIVKDRAERARAMADIENISNAINEFYAVYGYYPPTTGVAYEHQDSSLWPPSMRNPDAEFSIPHRYGLVAYIYPLFGEDPKYTADQAATAERWQHYLADVSKAGSTMEKQLDMEGGDQVYSNRVKTLKDPWNNANNYESKPPFLSYKLWSSNLD